MLDGEVVLQVVIVWLVVGKIVVIKGIGGFYLVCDVGNFVVVVMLWV